MFTVFGYSAGRLGTSAMFVGAIALCWPTTEPAWYFPLLMAIGLLWYAICARLWMLYWGHKILRDTLGNLFLAIGDYYTLKTDILLEKAGEESRNQFYKNQEAVYTFISQGKAYLERYDKRHYNSELTALRENFYFAVDVMELLQSSQHHLSKMRELIQTGDIEKVFHDMSVALIDVLKKKSFAIRTRGEADLSLDKPIRALEDSIIEHSPLADTPFVHSIKLHLEALRHLLNTQKPAFERKIHIPHDGIGVIEKLKPHLHFHSPPLRYALRLATTVCVGLLLVDWFDLHKSYWVILTILLVMQNGYLLTKTMITQRIIGTLAGVVIALVLIQIAGNGWILISLSLLVAIFSVCMVFFHQTLSIAGMTALIVLFYQLAFGSGEAVIFVRLEDSLIGCALAFASNVLLWPQWNGGGMKRLIQATLHAQEDLLVYCIRSLADKNLQLDELTDRRLHLYTAQNNLQASYQQMLREPQHTREYADSLDRLLSDFIVTSAHINTLIPMCRGITVMPTELTDHMEKLVIAMFHPSDDTLTQHSERFKDELQIVASKVKALQGLGLDSQHLIIIHLLGLIDERLNEIFEALDFCSKAKMHSS